MFQNWWLSLPSGMPDSNPEYQQRMRRSVGESVGELLLLILATAVTSYSVIVVFKARRW